MALANVALEESTIDNRDFYPKNVTICGFQVTNLMQHLGYEPRGDLKELADLVARGKLKVTWIKSSLWRGWATLIATWRGVKTGARL